MGKVSTFAGRKNCKTFLWWLTILIQLVTIDMLNASTHHVQVIPVLVVDSLSGGTNGMVGSANFDQNVTPLLRALQALASNFGIAVILCHHLKTKGDHGWGAKAGYEGFDMKSLSSKLEAKDICGSEVKCMHFYMIILYALCIKTAAKITLHRPFTRWPHMCLHWRRSRVEV